MDSSPTPIHLSDIQFSTASTTAGLYATLKSLRKTSLSLHKRLLSILHDADYVAQTVHATWFPHLPLIANERCGSWYIPPQLKGGSAYFKSTDGHYGAWAFSLRRLNLQVLDVLGQAGGAVLVDSTRRGKRMPDALRRTVPVWVLVWNRALFGEEIQTTVTELGWAASLQHPGLEAAEVALIEDQVQGWVDGLRRLGLNLDEIKRKVARPIKLAWIVHGEEFSESDLLEQKRCCEKGWNLLMLCSASRRVLGAEMSEDGYVQGAADDAEGWSGGLTSALFWNHTNELLATAEDELPDLVQTLVEEGKATRGEFTTIRITPTQNIFVAQAPPQSVAFDTSCYDLVLDCHAHVLADSSRVVNLHCRSGKLGSRDLRDKLSLATNHAAETLQKKADSRILAICETGRDLSVGVAVTLLCLLCNDQGQLITPWSTVADKQLVKKRLAWITSVKPDANPSRSTLQAVNSFLMQPPS